MRAVTSIVGLISGAVAGLVSASPANAAHDVTSTTDAIVYVAASQSPPVTGEWHVTREWGFPDSRSDSSVGSAVSGHSDGTFYGWVAEFPISSDCVVRSATLSIYSEEYIDTDHVPGSPLDLYAGSGFPTATQFSSDSNSEFVHVVPAGPAGRYAMDVTDAVSEFTAQAPPHTGAFIGVRAPGIYKDLRAWGAPFDRLDNRPTLTVTCASFDTDHDGIGNSQDICPKTVLPDKVTSLSKVRFAANSSGVFQNGAGGFSPSHEHISDTAGCSAIQIGQKLGPVAELDVRLWGLALNKLQKWADTH
jgi:hypothetical protein